MSTIHEFPKNYERFIAQGEEALVEHNQIAALENFQQAYQLQQTPPVNQKIVQLLLEMDEADEALALAEAFQDSYFENLETAAIYMQIYSQSRRFIEGYILLKQLLQKNNASTTKNVRTAINASGRGVSTIRNAANSSN